VRKSWGLLITLAGLCLADAGVLDYVEPILGTPVVATSVDYVTGVLAERGWTRIEADGESVTAVYVGDGRDESLTLTFTPAPSEADEAHPDIVEVEYTRVPWLELPDAVEGVRAEFDRLAAAFDYLVGPGVTEKNDEVWSHTWPGRDASRIELTLEPAWDTRLVAAVRLIPLREPVGD
jgi:hypothetical protein